MNDGYFDPGAQNGPTIRKPGSGPSKRKRLYVSFSWVGTPEGRVAKVVGRKVSHLLLKSDIHIINQDLPESANFGDWFDAILPWFGAHYDAWRDRKILAKGIDLELAYTPSKQGGYGLSRFRADDRAHNRVRYFGATPGDKAKGRPRNYGQSTEDFLFGPDKLRNLQMRKIWHERGDEIQRRLHRPHVVPVTHEEAIEWGAE